MPLRSNRYWQRSVELSNLQTTTNLSIANTVSASMAGRCSVHKVESVVGRGRCGQITMKHSSSMIVKNTASKIDI